jgi:DNA-directed RNA polymerase specialized sigma24 family protein
VDDERKDTVLWLEATTGTERSFGVPFDRYRIRVFRKTYAQLKSVHDAEDVVVIVFLEAWRSRAKVRIVDGAILPWLLSVTSYVLLNQARGTRRWQRLLAALPEPEEQADRADDVLDRLNQNAQLRAIYDAMTTLNAQERSIIDSAEFECVPNTPNVIELSADIKAHQIVTVAASRTDHILAWASWLRDRVEVPPSAAQRAEIGDEEVSHSEYLGCVS